MDPGRLNRLLDSLHAADGATPLLQRLCRVGADVTGGAGVGLSRIVDGAHEVVDASDADTREVELLQVTTAEGPCLDAIASYRPALEPDLASDRALDKWPKFARAAADRGIAAAYAFPLITGGVAIGALDIYSAVRNDFNDDNVENAIILADLAALAIDQGRGDIRHRGRRGLCRIRRSMGTSGGGAQRIRHDLRAAAHRTRRGTAPTPRLRVRDGAFGRRRGA